MDAIMSSVVGIVNLDKLFTAQGLPHLTLDMPLANLDSTFMGHDTAMLNSEMYKFVFDPNLKSKSTEVFAATELLELVFVNLSIEDLERCELVSHQWKDVIEKSPGCQKIRFLKSVPVTALLVEVRDPLTGEYLGTHITSPSNGDAADGHVIRQVHPAVQVELWGPTDAHVRLYFGHHDPADWANFIHRAKDKWSRVFVTNPPIMTVQTLFVCPSTGFTRDAPHEKWIVEEDGVTFGRIAGALTEMMAELGVTEADLYEYWFQEEDCDFVVKCDCFKDEAGFEVEQAMVRDRVDDCEEEFETCVDQVD